MTLSWLMTPEEEVKQLRQEKAEYQFLFGYLWGALQMHAGATEANRIVEDAKRLAKQHLG